MIHPTAVIHPEAKLEPNVSVGPYTVINEQVSIGAGTWIGPHVVIGARTVIGQNNRIFQFSSIGEEPQDLKYAGEETHLEIGNDNIIREFVTIHRGTEMGGGLTQIKNNCLFMAYVHVAHDCHVGSFVVMANGATLAGHIHLEDFAVIGGLSAIHQFSRIGAYAMIGGMSGIPNDVPPFMMAVGNRAKLYGLNLVGLKRHGFSAAELRDLKEAYRIIFRSRQPLSNALEEARTTYANSPRVMYLVDFIANSQRGIIR